MSVPIQLRRGTAAQWLAANPILAQGEVAVELDTHQFKIGNGITPWNALAYGGIVGPAGPQGAAGVAGITVLTPLRYDPTTQTLSLDNQLSNAILDGGNI